MLVVIRYRKSQSYTLKLKEINFYKPTSILSHHAKTIETYFREYPPASINAARDKIQDLTGITRSPTQVHHFLTSLGMRPRKVGMMPAKGDAKKQDAFKKKGTFQIPVDSLLTQTQRYVSVRQTNCSLLLPSRERCQKKSWSRD